ncbi:MAG: triose-phosphate isomerase [Pyrinomonadaceae bacterium]
MRQPIIAGNWKMYKKHSEAVNTAVSIRDLVSDATHCEIVIGPVFTALKAVADRLVGSNVAVAGQNCAAESEHGARTGEVCADMLADVGCSHVIIGHSERRQFFGETDQSVNSKVKSALQHGLTAIACVGETLEERESGNAQTVVGKQLRDGLEGLTVSDMKRIVIAYEPVWAIGTGKTATPEQAQEMHAFIRKSVGDVHGSDVSQSVRILYGGSVKPDNVSILMKQDDIDGALVGGASLDAESFASIVKYK